MSKSKIKAYYPSMNLELINELGFCGCGKPDEVYKLIYWITDKGNDLIDVLDEFEKLDYEYNNISVDEYWYILLNDDEYKKFENESNNRYHNGYKI